jgi:hypothetical protein
MARSSSLPQGEYDLVANYTPRAANAAPRPDDQQIGYVRMSVGGDAVAGVVINVGPGATVTGRFVFDGVAPPPASLGQMRVNFSGPNGPGCRSGRSETAADGTFTIQGVSGTCLARPGGPVARWTLKAILHDRVNLLDVPSRSRLDKASAIFRSSSPTGSPS